MDKAISTWFSTGAPWYLFNSEPFPLGDIAPPAPTYYDFPYSSCYLNTTNADEPRAR